MNHHKRPLAASKAALDARLQEERELQDAIRHSEQADISTASDSGNNTISESDDGRTTKASFTKKKKREAEEELSNNRAKNPKQSTGPESVKNVLKYPNGAIRITRTPGRHDSKNCVNLKDIIDKRSLVSACIYSFFIANEELFPYLPFSHSLDVVPIYIGRDPNMDPMIPVACAEAGLTTKGKVTKKQLELISSSLLQLHQDRYGKNYHTFYAWCSGSAHSKILVLVYPTFLRVVVTSCNMMDIDTELGDNHWYIHDLPKLAARRSSHQSQFENDLLAHLRALKVPEEFIDSIEGLYDYSKVKVHLITSVPGTWSGVKAEQHGLLQLRKVVKGLNLDLAKKRAENKVQLEVCAASIGNLNAKWLNGFYDCVLGSKDLRMAAVNNIKVPDMKIFYPTFGDVESTTEEAQNGASNIGCHTRPWDNAPREIKNIFHHYQSKDEGRLFHQKLILAYNPHDITKPPHLVYIGSANLSQSAWGGLEVDNRGNEATSGTKLMKMSNFECGVLIPGDLTQGLLEPGTSSWVDGLVPHDQNARQYDHKKDRPWNDRRWVANPREDWEEDFDY